MGGTAVRWLSLLHPFGQPSQRLLALAAGAGARGCRHFVSGKLATASGCYSLAIPHAPGSGGGREKGTCTAQFLYMWGHNI